MTTSSPGPFLCLRKLSAASPIAGGKEESSLKSRFSWVCQLTSSSLRQSHTEDHGNKWLRGSWSRREQSKSPVFWQKVQASCLYMAGPGVTPEGSETPSGLHRCRGVPSHHLICQTSTTPFQHKSPGTWRGQQRAVQINQDLHCWLPYADPATSDLLDMAFKFSYGVGFRDVVMQNKGFISTNNIKYAS